MSFKKSLEIYEENVVTALGNAVGNIKAAAGGVLDKSRVAMVIPELQRAMRTYINSLKNSNFDPTKQDNTKGIHEYITILNKNIEGFYKQYFNKGPEYQIQPTENIALISPVTNEIEYRTRNVKFESLKKNNYYDIVYLNSKNQRVIVKKLQFIDYGLIPETNFPCANFFDINRKRHQLAKAKIQEIEYHVGQEDMDKINAITPDTIDGATPVEDDSYDIYNNSYSEKNLEDSVLLEGIFSNLFKINNITGYIELLKKFDDQLDDAIPDLHKFLEGVKSRGKLFPPDTMEAHFYQIAMSVSKIAVFLSSKVNIKQNVSQ